MRRWMIALLLIAFGLSSAAQEDSRVLRPNYRRIARVCKDPQSPYFADSLRAHFARCDTVLTVDGYRCLYYGRFVPSLVAHRQLREEMTRTYGANSRAEGIAAWQFELLWGAVWSSGRGSRQQPLHVVCRADAQCICDEMHRPLWFKERRGRCYQLYPTKVSEAPPQ